jgi:putative membrane protein
LSRLAVVAGAVGVLSQLGDELPIVAADNVTSAWGWLTAFALPLVIVSVLLAGVVAWTVVSVAGYVLQWWALLLVRERGLVRLTAGLLTTRSTSVEEARIRGVELTEPVLLRLVGGGELATLATGVGEGGVTKVLPPCPVEVAVAVGHTLLEEDGPLVAPLVSHGRLARRRCHLRAQWPTLGLTALSIVPILVLDLDWWIALVVLAVVGAVGLLTAEMEWRHLGHTLTDQHLVVGSGALERTRTALERDGVIGWVVSQSLFQRRLGLATLTATTAAGAESVTVRDLALERAVALADATTPHLLADFLVHAVVRPPASGERPGSTVPAGRGQQ